MTIDEFNETSFGAGDRAKYTDGRVYAIASVDFQEKLIGLIMHISGGNPNEITWVRCENIEHFSFASVQMPNND
jgi:hypothetical protein